MTLAEASMTVEAAEADANQLARQALAQQPITIVTEPPGPLARALIQRERPFVSPSLVDCYPLAVRRASGCMVEDLDGNIYLDCEAGVATASTGHCHPAVAAAIAEQAQVLIHICGTDFHYPGYGALCERLAGLAERAFANMRMGTLGGFPNPPATGPGEASSPGSHALRNGGSKSDGWQSFLTNSGTEGVEAAIKLARYATKRSHLIAFRGGFHGRTLGSLSLTASKAKYRKHFGPLLPGVHHATYGVADSIEKELFAHTVSPEDVAAIVVEPVQGEGGYVVPPADFLPRLRALCDAHGILLVFDEVQTGMGRTGRMFASEHFGVVPDVMVLAKGIASGMPLGAMMAKKEMMKWTAGTHGSTIAGNPVCIAAAMATIDLLEGGLVENAARVGALLKNELTASLAGHSAVEEVRGLGLMIGVEMRTPELADAVAQLCFRRGLLVLECGKKAIRFAPPLLLSEAQAATAAQVFTLACTDVARDARP
jgi:4-aminobutyrate aminotransferase